MRRGPAAVRSLVPHRLALTAVTLTAILAATLLAGLVSFAAIVTSYAVRVTLASSPATSILITSSAGSAAAAAQVMPGQAVLGQFPLDHVLRGDARVVHTGQPQRRVPLHPPPPDQRVHKRVIERMAHVQGPGHVRRRDHDGVRRRGRAGVRGEQALGDPLVVAPRLHLARRVLRR